MVAFLDVTGRRFGLLTVVSLGPKSRAGRNRWVCACDCGGTALVGISDLRSGHTASCSCAHRNMLRERLTTHGGTRTPEYSSWCNMKDRCLNPNNPKFVDYGGRGISICARWLHDFEAFRDDMGPKPSAKHTVDRIGNSGNYEPGNCRWATPTTQARNTRRTRYVQVGNRVGKLTEIADELGIAHSTLKARARRGSYGVRYVESPAA